jgi:hypothetical protein
MCEHAFREFERERSDVYLRENMKNQRPARPRNAVGWSDGRALTLCGLGENFADRCREMESEWDS